MATTPYDDRATRSYPKPVRTREMFLIVVCYTCETVTAIDYEPGKCECEVDTNIDEIIPTEAISSEAAVRFHERRLRMLKPDVGEPLFGQEYPDPNEILEHPRGGG